MKNVAIKNIKKKVYYYYYKINIRILLFFIISVALFSCKKDDFSDIYDEPGYALGTIETYISTPLKVTYSYSFNVDENDYNGKYVVKGIGQLNEELIGQSYLVIYKLSNINENILDFNYHIEDQEEFKELLETFKTDPPKPD